MKKIILALLLVGSAFAVGPKIPCILTFTPSPTPDVTGYWFYWRATNGIYSDAQRWQIPASGQSGYDLRVIGLAKGDYYTMMTATNATAESDPSVEFFWHYSNPNRPNSILIQ